MTRRQFNGECIIERLQKTCMDRLHSEFQNQRSETYAIIDRLTAREKEVIELLFAGKTIKSIARHLGVTYQTAARHRTRALGKLSLENEVELVHFLYLSIMTQRRDPFVGL